MKAGIVTTISKSDSVNTIVSEMKEQIKNVTDIEKLKGGIIYATVDTDLPALQKSLNNAFPGIPYLGVTSCQGIGYDGSFLEGGPVSGLWFYGNECKFGVTSLEKNGDPEILGDTLLKQSISSAGISKDDVNFAVLFTTPGDEEYILKGIQNQDMRNTYLIGGSAADNDITGNWKVWSHEIISDNAAILATGKWPYKLAFKFRGGFIQRSSNGIATKAKGRVLYEIDGKPAADVYNKWMKNALAKYIESGESILAATSLTPLAVTRKGAGGLTKYISVHPEKVILPEKALNLFAEIKENETVHMLSTYKSIVVERGGRTAHITRQSVKAEKENIEAALMIYCAGSMLTIRDEIDEMVKGLKENLSGLPHMVGFTFGEQGTVFRGQFEHGNLMNSILLFTNIE
jgi:hypothetical protein